jgi:hypothetical protein
MLAWQDERPEGRGVRRNFVVRQLFAASPSKLAPRVPARNGKGSFVLY